MKTRGLAALFCALAVTSAFAVFPDRTETGYRSVGMIGTTTDGVFKLNGGGVAVAPYWVLSVAHVGGNTYVQDGVRVPIERKYTHASSDGKNADLAIFKLSSPVDNYSPTLLAPFDGPSGTLRLKNRTAFLVGYGRTATPRSDGTGWAVLSGTEGKRRSATNRIDFADIAEHNIGTEAVPKIKTSNVLVYDLDKPNDPSFSTLGTLITDREGGLAAKDSGGAWFVIVDGKVQLVAISVGVGRLEGSTLVDSHRYGAIGMGVHLLPYKDWIYSITGLPEFGPIQTGYHPY